MEIGQDACQALEPQAQSLFVVALATNRMDPAEAVMAGRDNRGHQLVPTVVVDVVEGLADSLLDDRAIKHDPPPDCENGIEASPPSARSRTLNDGDATVVRYEPCGGSSASRTRVRDVMPSFGKSRYRCVLTVRWER